MKTFFNALMLSFCIMFIPFAQPKVSTEYYEQDGLKKANVVIDVPQGYDIAALSLEMDYPDNIVIYGMDRGKDLPTGIYVANSSYKGQNSARIGWVGWSGKANPILGTVTVCEITYDVKTNIFEFDKSVCEAANSTATVITNAIFESEKKVTIEDPVNMLKDIKQSLNVVK